MIGKRPALGGSQKLADPKHHIARIGPPPALPPLLQLLGEVSGRLAGKRRVGGPEALALLAVAGRAAEKSAIRIALQPQPAWLLEGARFGGERHPRIVKGNGPALSRVELLGNGSHQRMVPPPVGIGDQLPLEITGIDPSQPRDAAAVAASAEPVARYAGVGGAGRSSAERDQLAGGAETVGGSAFRNRAAAEKHGRGKDEGEAAGHGAATSGTRWRFRSVLLPLLLLANCKPPPEPRQDMPQASAERGKEAIERVGCGSCHRIPGIAWPQGKVGPPLDTFSGRALIAGRLPNRPDLLAAYIRNAPAMVPGSGMPAMPVTEEEARNIASYLYEQRSE